MAAFPAQYIRQKVQEYLSSSDGQALIRKYQWDVFEGKKAAQEGMLTRADTREYLTEIKEIFWNGVSEVIQSFSRNIADIYAEIGEREGGGIKASISVNKEALHRSSLHYMRQSSDGATSIGHGDGIDDILALFTHGYTLGSRPYGFWVRENGDSMTRIGAKMHRDPNPFMQNIVNEINTKYSGICTATLDDKYIH